jgi:serine phosphatase RsbU (regulator of sigma subunit)
VDVEQLLGQVLERDIKQGEQIDGDLDRLIERRHEKRVREEGERKLKEEWRETERKHAAARDAELRAEWSEYHRTQAERHRAVLEALASHHERRAEELMTPRGGGDAA